MVNRTRRRRGGFYTKSDKSRVSQSYASKSEHIQEQIVHCVTQLKRFAPCLKSQPLRAYQFFYNLGRLQELLGEPKATLWWSPMETLLAADKYEDVEKHVDSLREMIGVEYDAPTLAKGC